MGISYSDLRKYTYFSSISDEGLKELSHKLALVKIPVGTEIVKEGERGDSFYFVKHGELEVTKKSPSGLAVKLSVIGNGQGFGEMALLTCTVRSSSVRALTDVELYKLTKTDFEDIVLQESVFKSMLFNKAKEYMQFNRIKTFQPFALLEPARLFAVMEKMTEEHYGSGDNIIRQGDRGDKYYIIKAGSVAVLKKNKSGENKKIAELAAGEAFGEEALIREDPRNATCQAIEKTTVLALNKKAFNRIVKDAFLENIFPEDIPLDTYLDEYTIIDARIPAEYEEEHIYGAVNIPVEVLREQSSTFDRSKKYVTYCLNDSRGMVAAFLLKNRGFNAQCLRGGVSGWTGKVETGSDGIYMPEDND